MLTSKEGRLTTSADMPSQAATRSELHEGALQWASAGFYVFPCVVGAKVPATENGLLDATVDPAQINLWWTQQPEYNIGVVPARSGMFVLDVDGPLGAEALARLEGCNQALPSTLTVQTPRGPGHSHYWFKGDAPTTVAKLGPKLDTRGVANGRYGYVLVPPSRTPTGNYTYASETDDIADGPTWIVTKLRTPQVSAANPDAILDDPSNITRAVARLKTMPPAIEGQGGDDCTYRTICELRELGLSSGMAFKQTLEHFNPRCDPPWDSEELKTKVANVYEYAQNDPGAYAVAPAATLFAAVAASAPYTEVPHTDEKSMRFYPMDEEEMSTIPTPTWLLPDLIPARSLVLMIGQYESFKSFLALDLSLTLASGLAGWDCDPREGVPVVYAPSEGRHAIARHRKPAWKLARKIEDQQIPFYMVEDVPWLKFDEDINAFIKGIQSRKLRPKLVVIDTVASAMLGLNENDAHDIGFFIQAAKSIKNAFDCTVLAVHHLGKDKERGSRGSSALPAGFDTILRVEARQATRTVTVTVEKQKDAEKRKMPYHFQGDVIGPSLVFSPCAASVIRALSSQDDTLGHAAVAAALRVLGALSTATAVSTRVLASHMCPQADSDTADTYDRAVRGFARELNARAKDKLEAFTIGEGRDIRWYIPAQEEPEEQF